MRRIRRDGHFFGDRPNVQPHVDDGVLPDSELNPAPRDRLEPRAGHVHFVLARLQQRNAVSAGCVGLELARRAGREAHHEDADVRNRRAARIGDAALKTRAHGLRVNETGDEHGCKADRKQATRRSFEHNRLQKLDTFRVGHRRSRFSSDPGP